MKAFQRFYRQNEERLFGYLLQRSGDHFLAADLVQEAFARYLQHYHNRGHNVALLFTIGRNLFYDFLRQRQKTIALSEDTIWQPTPDQEELYAAREDLQRLRQAWQRLSGEERDILAMVVRGGLDYLEIAEILSCSRESVKVKVHRARKKLRRIMREIGDE